ncbi:hypothetical protein RND81_07G198600 [Saponaria officinalis]|uniref:Uncharacterized protein n=1 Tax=Saponaria officinalis TaxID=3572 RepID=A0AAW1JV77_SAPOF
MSKPWGGSGIGSWAAEAELAEAEERQAAATAAAANPQSFPSLKDAVTTKPKKKKMTLSEFYGSGSGSGSGLVTTRLTPDEMIHLPTGPKVRAPDEYGSGGGGGGGSRLGGGFRSYGDGGGGGGSGRRGGYDEMGPPPPVSRADEVDNWGAMKRSVPVERERERGSTSSSTAVRYGGLGGGSRADEVDNWSFDKKPVPGPGHGVQTRLGGGGVGAGAAGRPRLVLEPRSSGKEGNEGVVVVGVKVNKASPFGAARPREEVLAEKGLDWKKLDSEIEAKKVVVGVGSGGGGGSRPTSSQGSRPTSSQSSRSESVAVVVGGGGGGEVRPRAKVNPFGDAKPREVLLEEKGLDWRKIDLQLEHRRVDRPETEEEKALKEEIEMLKKDLEKESVNDVSQGSGGEQTNLRGLIESKERDLETLTRELDDKIRFGQKPVERPGSGAGRPGSGAGRPGSGAGRPASGAGRYMGFQDRPPPQSGPYDDYRGGAEAMDRPRSRGTGGDIWTRPGEDRRGSFQGNRDRGGFVNSNRDRGGFVNNSNFNRSTSRW